MHLGVPPRKSLGVRLSAPSPRADYSACGLSASIRHAKCLTQQRLLDLALDSPSVEERRLIFRHRTYFYECMTLPAPETRIDDIHRTRKQSERYLERAELWNVWLNEAQATNLAAWRTQCKDDRRDCLCIRINVHLVSDNTIVARIRKQRVLMRPNLFKC